MRARPKILLCRNYEEAAQPGDRLSRIPVRRRLRCRVSHGRQAHARRRIRAGEHGPQPGAGCSHRAPVQPHQVHGARPRRGLRVSAQAFAHPAGATCGGCSPISSPSAISSSACPTAPKWPAPKISLRWRKRCARFPPRASPTTASAITFRAGCGRAPNLLSRRSFARARSPTSPTSRPCARTSSAPSPSTGATSGRR